MLSVAGFWIQEGTYVEQPRVQFKQQAIVTLLDAASSTQLAWSTFPSCNLLAQAALRVPVVKVPG